MTVLNEATMCRGDEVCCWTGEPEGRACWEGGTCGCKVIRHVAGVAPHCKRPDDNTTTEAR